jgi:hypothetical protein
MDLSESSFSIIGFKNEDKKSGLIISGKPPIELPLLPKKINVTICCDRSLSMSGIYSRCENVPQYGKIVRTDSVLPFKTDAFNSISAPILKRADGASAGAGAGTCVGVSIGGGEGGTPTKYDTMLKSINRLCEYVSIVNNNERIHETTNRINLKILSYDNMINCIVGTQVDTTFNHIVIYPEDIDDHFNERLVNGLTPRGNTDIYGVLNKAFEGVSDTPSVDTTDLVMLVTDGFHNEGLYSDREVIERFVDPDSPFKNKKKIVTTIAFGGPRDFDMNFLQAVSDKVITAYHSREAYDGMIGAVFDTSTTLTNVQIIFPSVMTILNNGIELNPDTKVSFINFPQFYLSQMIPIGFILNHDADHIPIRIKYTDAKGYEHNEVYVCDLFTEEYHGSINQGINLYVESLNIFSEMVESTKTQLELRNQAIKLHELMKSFVPRDPINPVWIKFSELFNGYISQLNNFIDSTYIDKKNYDNMMSIAQSHASAFQYGKVPCLSRHASDKYMDTCSDDDISL